MDTTWLETLEQVRTFLAGVSDVQLHVLQRDVERRRFVERTLRWFGYLHRPRAERGLLFAYVLRVSGYSRAQVIRLIAQFRDSGTLALRERGVRTRFARRYTDEDVARLAELDSLHDTLSGAVTRVLAQRAWQVYGDSRYERLDHISVSQLLLRFKHPEHGYRSALGLLSLAKRHGRERLEVACALAQYACRQGHSARYLRVPRLAEELRTLRAAGSYSKWLAQLGKIQVLVLDDLGLTGLDALTREALMEILDDRIGTRATLVTSQLPVEHWHAWIGDPAMADAMLDRLLPQAHRLVLKGESLRARHSPGTAGVTPAAGPIA